MSGYVETCSSRKNFFKPKHDSSGSNIDDLENYNDYRSSGKYSKYY